MIYAEAIVGIVVIVWVELLATARTVHLHKVIYLRKWVNCLVDVAFILQPRAYVNGAADTDDHTDDAAYGKFQHLEPKGFSRRGFRTI